MRFPKEAVVIKWMRERNRRRIRQVRTGKALDFGRDTLLRS